MKKYNFLRNIEKHRKSEEEELKKIQLGLLIHSLQRPAQEILQAVCEKQIEDVRELCKSLGWTK